MLTLLHSVIDRGEYEKYLFLPPYGNMKYSLMTARAPMIDVSSENAKDDYTLFSVLSNVLQNVLQSLQLLSLP